MNDVLTPQLLSPELPPAPPASGRIEFANERPVFRRLAMRGAMLELITVGFYRFWLATDMRRHLWSHTSVEGDAPEYTGTAKELLIGFLFALAILMPVYGAYFLLGIEAERFKAFASTPLALFYYLFIQFAVYRARRYRLTRTVWRGVRFSMGGSGINYALRVGLWTLLALITVGFAMPWRQAALERYKMRNTAYGSLQGQFAGTGGGLFKRSWWMWVSLPIVLVGVPLLIVKSTGVGVTLLILLMLVFPFVFAAYKAIEWRWWASGIHFGDVRFESELGSKDLIGLYWKMIGWAVLLTILLVVWIGGVTAIAYAMYGDAGSGPEVAAQAMQQPAILVGVAIGYLAYVLAFWTVMRMYLIHDLWGRVVNSVTVHNLAAAVDVAEQGQTVNALGEGLADSLDIGGF